MARTSTPKVRPKSRTASPKAHPKSRRRGLSYNERVLAAVFTLAKRRRKNQVSLTSLRNYIVAQARSENEAKPNNHLVTNARRALEEEGILVHGRYATELPSEVKEAINKERKRAGSPTSDDERAAVTFLSSRRATTPGSTIGRKSPTPRPRTKKRRSSRVPSPELLGEEGIGASQEVGNEEWRRRGKKQKRATRKPSTVVESEEEEEEEEESEEEISPKARKRRTPKPRPAAKARATAGRGKAKSGAAAPPTFPPPSTTLSALSRFKKIDLIALVQQASKQVEDKDAEIESVEERLAKVSEGFVELRKICEGYKGRLSKYEIVGDEEEEEEAGSEAEVEKQLLRSPTPEGGEDLGGMGDMDFGEADDSGYFGAGDVSDADTVLEDSASFVKPEGVSVALTSKVSLELPPATQHRPSTQRTHSFASIHAPSPASSQFGEEDVGRAEHEEAVRRSPPRSKLPTPALSSSPIKAGASTAGATSVLDEMEEERDEHVEGLGMEGEASRLRQKVESLRAELQEKEKALKTYAASKASLTWEISALARQYQDLSRTSASRETELEKELVDTQNQLAERTAVAASHELSLQSNESELGRLRNEIRLAEELSKNLRDEIATLNSTRSEDSAHHATEIDLLIQSRDALSLALEEFHEERKQFAARVVEVEAELLLVRTTIVKPPTIDASSATGPDPRISQLESQLDDARIPARDAQERFKVDLATLEATRDEEVSRLSSSLDLVTQSRDRLSVTLKTAQDERNQVTARLVEAEAELATARTTLVTKPSVDAAVGTGPDPRIAKLETQVEDLRKASEESKTRFDLELAALDTALRAEIKSLVVARAEDASLHASTLALVTEPRDELSSALAKAQKEHEQVAARLVEVETAFSFTKQALETRLEVAQQKAADADARIDELVATEGTLRLDVSLLTDARTQDASNHAVEIDLLTRARDDLSSAFAAAQLEHKNAVARIVEVKAELSAVRTALGQQVDEARAKGDAAEARVEELSALERMLRDEIEAISDLRTEDASRHTAELSLVVESRDKLSSDLAATQKEKEQLDARLVKAEEDLSTVGATLEDAKAELTATLVVNISEKEVSDKKIDELTRELVVANAELDSTRRELEEDRGRMGMLRDELEVARAEMADERRELQERIEELLMDLDSSGEDVEEERRRAEGAEGEVVALREQLDAATRTYDDLVAQEAATQERLSTLAAESTLIANRLRNIAATHGHLAPSTPTLDLDAVSDTLGRLGSSANEQAAILAEAQDLVDSILAAFPVEFVPPIARSSELPFVNSLKTIRHQLSLLSTAAQSIDVDLRDTRGELDNLVEGNQKIVDAIGELATELGRGPNDEAALDLEDGLELVSFLQQHKDYVVELFVQRSAGELEREELRLRVEEGVAKLAEVSNAFEERTSALRKLESILAERQERRKSGLALIDSGRKALEEEEGVA